jgi:hypothetical protein
VVLFKDPNPFKSHNLPHFISQLALFWPIVIKGPLTVIVATIKSSPPAATNSNKLSATISGIHKFKLKIS